MTEQGRGWLGWVQPLLEFVRQGMHVCLPRTRVGCMQENWHGVISDPNQEGEGPPQGVVLRRRKLRAGGVHREREMLRNGYMQLWGTW